MVNGMTSKFLCNRYNRQLEGSPLISTGEQEKWFSYIHTKANYGVTTETTKTLNVEERIVQRRIEDLRQNNNYGDLTFFRMS